MTARSLLTRAQYAPLIGVSIYVALALLLTVPTIQRHFIFLHKIKFPLNADFERPEKYGISPGKARNLRLTTQDGVSIGAWHVLPDAYHRRLQPTPLNAANSTSPGFIPDDQYDFALREYPTIIYLHGNAANRAAPFRTASYAQFTSRLQANVIAIDYRGFGDSEGIPSEDGLVLDAKAAWDFVQSKRQNSQRFKDALSGHGIVFASQSLGTGVGSKVTRQLVEQGTPPQALVLIAPYRSLRKLLTQYRIGGLIPILAPALWIPFANQILDHTLKTNFASDENLPALFTAAANDNSGNDQLEWPHVIISHATDDEVIPYSHGELLFESTLRGEIQRRGKSLSNTPTTMNISSSAQLTTSLLSKELLEAGNVRTILIPGWARIEQFELESFAAKYQKVPSITLIRTEHGGHNTVGEGIVDIVRDITGLGQIYD
ncbi:unnamed protein product [Sympodiomycopsis kandeliae]